MLLANGCWWMVVLWHTHAAFVWCWAQTGKASISEEVTSIRCYRLGSDQKPAAPYWLLTLNLSPSPSRLFPITPCTVCRPCCQRQQGLLRPGNRGVSLTHMAQAVCFFSFSLPSTSFFFLYLCFHLYYSLFPKWLTGNAYYVCPCYIASWSFVVILFSTDGAFLMLLFLSFLLCLGGYSSRRVLQRPVLLKDVGTQAVKRDTLLEHCSHGWNRVTAPLKML